MKDKRRNGGILMTHKAEYRSAVRSKELIKSAFIELIRTKPIDRITVTNIVEKADLNRGTFYAHYADINALIKSIEEEIVQNLCERLYNIKGNNFFKEPLPLFMQISEYLENNKELISVIINSSATSSFVMSLPDLITEHLLSSKDMDKKLRKDPQFQMKCRFYAGGAGSIYTAWFNGSIEGSLYDVARMLEAIIKSQRL